MSIGKAQAVATFSSKRLSKSFTWLCYTYLPIQQYSVSTAQVSLSVAAHTVSLKLTYPISYRT